MISAAPAPCFLSLSFKSILKECHQHDLPKAQLWSATFNSFLLPAFPSMEFHTSEFSWPSPFWASHSFPLCILGCGQTRHQLSPQPFTKLLPFWPCYPYYLECPVTSSRDNAILDINTHNTQLKCYLPSETFPNPSTRYNQVGHFIKAHLLSTYYVSNWLEGPDGGRGRKQERHELCLQRDSLLCRCEWACTHTYRIQRKKLG